MNNDLEQFGDQELQNIIDFSDSDTMTRLARIALSVKQANPVAQVYQPANIGICAALGPAIRMINVGLPAGTLLYTTAQPAHTEVNSPEIPDGWKLVPIEPTAGMHTAARDWSVKKYGMGVGIEGSDGCYKAMLAAAPKPESE